MSTRPTDELLRPADVERAYGNGLNVETLKRLRRDSNGPHWLQLSRRRIAYKRSDVEAWIEQLTQAGAA